MKTVLLLIGVMLCSIEFAEAQQTKKVPRVGFLFIGSKDQPHLSSFRQALRDLGYVEGNNISLQFRYAEGNSKALATLASELASVNSDVIVTTTPGATRAVLGTRTVPIVIVGFDPVATGFAKTLAKPGGNVTGPSSRVGPDMQGKRLELLKETFPTISVVAALWNPEAGPFAESVLEDAKRGAKALGIRIQPHEIKTSKDIDAASQVLKKMHADALLIPGGRVMTLNSKRLVRLASELRLPAMYQTPQFVEDGGLMSYGVNYGELYRRAATYVDKILKGAKAADLPVELPMKFEFTINLQSATQIGRTIPPQVLARADRVIK